MQALIKTGVTKKTIDVFNLKEEDIDIRDIAHALAQVNRFGGHVDQPISVAQHSVYVSYLSEHCGQDRQGLLHDASEAYLGDVTKWVKGQPEFALYREIEERVQRLIFRRYGCSEEQHPGVTHADKRMCTFEAEQGGMIFDFSAPGYEPTTHGEREVLLKVFCWEFVDWRIAEEMFLARFHSIFMKSRQVGSYQ
jgi:hypothetical protein